MALPRQPRALLLPLLATLVLLAAPAGTHAAGGGAADNIASVRAWVERIGVLSQRYPIETGLLAVIGIYLATVIAGRRENLRLAQEWSDTFCGPDSLFEQQFSAHGAIGDVNRKNDPLWWREGPCTFKIWATGRRFCSGMLVLIETPPLHDLTKRIVPRASSARVDIEVVMREGAMAPMVLAAAPLKGIKALLKTNADVRDFTKRVEIPKDRLPLWPTGAAAGGAGGGAGGGWGGRELAVMSESQGLFFDLFGDARVQQLIARDAGVAKHLKQIIFSTEGSLGKPDRKLFFSMGLPPPGQMEELRGILHLVLLLTDIVGSYKLGADAASKAAALRQKVSAAREERKGKEEAGAGGGGGGAQQERQMAAMMRRMDKLQEERDKARRQGPKALEKFEERLRKQQMKKQMKKSTVKMG